MKTKVFIFNHKEKPRAKPAKVEKMLNHIAFGFHKEQRIDKIKKDRLKWKSKIRVDEQEDNNIKEEKDAG